MAKYELKIRARELRKQGLSLKEIRKHIPASKSSVSLWVRDVELTEEQKARLNERKSLNGKRGREKARETRLAMEEAKREDIRREARLIYKSLKDDPFFIAGLIGYWSEGTKSENEFVISNSDPSFIKLIIKWLNRYFHVSNERIQLGLHIHTDIDEKECKDFWMVYTGITNFRKAHIKKSSLGHRKNLLYRGTVQLRVKRSARLFYIVQEWIESYKKEELS